MLMEPGDGAPDLQPLVHGHHAEREVLRQRARAGHQGGDQVAAVEPALAPQPLSLEAPEHAQLHPAKPVGAIGGQLWRHGSERQARLPQHPLQSDHLPGQAQAPNRIAARRVGGEDLAEVR